MNFAVRNLVLHAPGTLPPPVPPAFFGLLHDCQLWWGQYDIRLAFGRPEVLEAPLNTTTDEPWPQAAGWWQNRPDYDIHALVTVFLAGWDSQRYIGWGGRLGRGGLAVVGEYAIQRILSRPTTPDDPTDWADPESLVDDRAAGKLYNHELGHAMGLPHDFADDLYVMSYGGHGFNSILGEPSQQELTALWTPGEREVAYQIATCRSREWLTR